MADPRSGSGQDETPLDAAPVNDSSPAMEVQQQPQVEAVAQDNEADHKPEDSPPVTGAKANIPPSERGYYEAKQKKEKRWRTIKQSFELAAIAAAVVYTILTYYLWKNAIEANRIARENFIADQRPWVSVDAVMKDGITWRPTRGGTFSVVFRLKNVGKTPARDVSVLAWVYPQVIAPARMDGDRREQKRVCTPGKEPGRSQGMGVVLFPGEDGTEGWELAVSNADLETIRNAYSSAGRVGEEDFYLEISGCVTYLGGMPDEPERVTGFDFLAGRISQSADGHQGIAPVAPNDGNIPSQALGLHREGFSNYAE